MEYGFTQKLFGYFYHSSCMKQAAKQKLDINKKRSSRNMYLL